MTRFVAFVLALLHAATLAAAIRGSLFDDEGKPVAGVTVRAYRAEGSAARRVRIITRAERPAFASATTDKDGAFTLDTKRSGMFEVLVVADRYAPARQLVFADDTIVFGLVPAPPRTVTVTADGKPVANATVVGLGANLEVDLGQTNEQGTLAVPDPRAWCVSLAVLHPDYAPEQQLVALRTSFAFALTAGERVTGIVVDTNGKPVANAAIRAADWLAGRSGEDGTFTLPHVAADAKQIDATTATLRGFASRGAKETKITAEPLHSITGTVTDDARHVIAGMAVAAYPAEGVTRETFFGITDDHGAYRIDVPASTYTVVPMGSTELEFTSSTAELRTKDSLRADFAATRPERLRGIVRDARNKPVAGAIVSYLGERTPLIYASLVNEGPVVRSAADGSFALPSLEEQRKIVALHPRFAAATADAVDNRATVVMPDGIEVTGTVVDADDEPVAGAGVIVVQDPKSAMAFPLDVLLASGVARAFAETGGDGTFRLHLNAAVHDVAVWKEGFSAARIANYRPGKPLRLVLGRGVTIEGRVTGGSDLTGAVYARGAENSVGIARIEQDGSFVISSLAAGKYTVIAQTGAGMSEEKIVEAPAANVVIEMPQMAEIRGTVVDKESGDPISSYSYMAAGSAGEITDGAPFTISVQRGETTVIITANGYASLSREVKATAGKTTEARFELAKGRTVRGHVVDESGAPMRQVSVALETEGLSFGGSAQTDDAGEFVLEGLPREPITLAFMQEDFRTERVDVAAELTEPLTVTLTRGRVVTGRVVDETGTPVAGAEVSATSAANDSSWRNDESAADGTFRLQGLGEGRHSFRAVKSGYPPAELNDVDIRKTPSIVLRFGHRAPTGAIHGRVTGYSGGGYIVGQVMVTPDSDEYEQIATAEIDRDGSFRVEDAPAGDVKVRALAYGMNKQRTSGIVKATVVAGGDVQVDLIFRDDVVVSGTVTENGTPVSGRHVAFTNAGVSWQAVTDDAGHYEAVGIEPGHYDVSVYGPHRSAMYRTQYDANGSGTFDIAMEFGRIEGRVTDSEGAPIDGATVEIAQTSLTTDATGTFSAELARGEYDVRVTKRGFASAIQKTSAGSAPLSFRLTRSDGIRVRLVDARDNATLGGYVIARDSAGVQLNRVHDQERDGSLRISVVAGTYRISASADGYATQTVVTNVPRENELRIALTPGGTLVVQTDHDPRELVKLVHPNGEEYVRCECNGIAEIRLTGRTTTIEHVAPGQYTMRVLDANGKVVATQPVTVTEGGLTTVSF